MRLGNHTAHVPHRHIFYPPKLKDRWDKMWADWLASGRSEPSVWEEFEFLDRTPGFQLLTWNGGRFAEAMVARDLHRQGYKCFLGCKLFP